VPPPIPLVHGTTMKTRWKALLGDAAHYLESLEPSSPLHDYDYRQSFRLTGPVAIARARRDSGSDWKTAWLRRAGSRTAWEQRPRPMAWRGRFQ